MPPDALTVSYTEARQMLGLSERTDSDRLARAFDGLRACIGTIEEITRKRDGR